MNVMSIYLFLKYENKKVMINSGATIGELAMDERNRPNGWLEILYHNQETFG